MSIKQELIEKLSHKYNVSLKDVEHTVNYQAKYVSQTIRDGKFEAVRLPYFGVFRVHPGRLKHLKNTKVHKNKNKK